MTFEEIYNWIKSFNYIQSMNLVEKALKTSEEVGELSAEILRFKGYKNQVSKNENIEAILEEGCDVIVTILLIFAHFGFSDKQMIDIIQKKINKWLKKLEAEEWINK